MHRQQTAQPQQMAILKRFANYKPMEATASRDADVRPVDIEPLMDVWKHYLKQEMPWSSAQRYSDFMDDLERLKYNKGEVEAIAIALADFQDAKNFQDKTGFFLSHAINICPDDDFTIQTGQFSMPINRFGVFNKKKITVVGSLGDKVGESNMGILRIKGDVEGGVGNMMCDGLITVEGCSSPEEIDGGVLIIKDINKTDDPSSSGFQKVTIYAPRAGMLFITGDFPDDLPIWIMGATYGDYQTPRNDGVGIIYISAASNLADRLEDTLITGGNVFLGDMRLRPMKGPGYPSDI